MMLSLRIKHFFLSSITGITLILLSAVSSQAMETNPNQDSRFQKIPQPLPVKIGVTAGGIGLIGLELWWFLFSEKTAKKAEEKDDTQEVTITVDGGYDPTEVIVTAGKPVRINFHRRDPSSCLQQVLIPDFNQSVDLALNEITSVEFTPQETGEYEFTCGMKMYRGKIIVNDQGT
jgi:plastocyanin domain-containing protein